MKNGGKNKSVAFIILFSVVKGNREKIFSQCLPISTDF